MDYGLTTKKSKRRARRKHEDFGYFERSSSEPDLSDHAPSRWRSYPHEVITVDELKFYRRRKPPDHTKSHFSLYNKSEPSIPFSELKTEYKREYSHPELSPRPKLSKRPTSLKFEGKMSIVTEQQLGFPPHSEDVALRSRRQITRNPENLTLEGSQEMAPEYRSAFVPYTIEEQRNAASQPNEVLKIEGELNLMPTKKPAPPQPEHVSIISPQKCQLKLEGELTYCPTEYRDKFITFPIERSHSIPQLNNIRFQGDFKGVAEYTDRYKSYDHFSRSVAIKNPDHLSLSGMVEGLPEYKEKYKEPDRSTIAKVLPMKPAESIQLPAGFKKPLPEYSESFKNPNITIAPEKAKARASHLKLNGTMDYNPEYRCTYLDFPRARPIINKPGSTMRLYDHHQPDKQPSPPKRYDRLQARDVSPQKSRYETPAPLQQTPRDPSPPKRFVPTRSPEPNFEPLPIECQPEYRKVQRELQIRERHPPRLEIGNVGYHDQNVLGLPQVENYAPNSRRSSRSSAKSDKKSPHFRLMVENVDIGKGSFLKKASPKYGRRASGAHSIRNRTKVIEGNPTYLADKNNFGTRVKPSHLRSDQKPKDNPSFIVLQEPCKQSQWMKPSWYDT